MFNFLSNKTNSMDNILMTMTYNIPLIEEYTSEDNIVEIKNANNKSLFNFTNVKKSIQKSIYKSIYKNNNKNNKDYKSINKFIKHKYKKHNYMEYTFYKN